MEAPAKVIEDSMGHTTGGRSFLAWFCMFVSLPAAVSGGCFPDETQDTDSAAQGPAQDTQQSIIDHNV